MIRDDGLVPVLKGDVPDFFRDICKLCWREDPESRPSMDVLCQYLNLNNEK